MRIVPALFTMLMPGFGQVYNRQYIKGTLFLLYEHFCNAYGNMNEAIHLDLTGHHKEAISTCSYDYLLFYPGFYVYSVWDAWFYAKEGGDKFKTAVPYVIGGFLGELCAIYSSLLPFPTLIVFLAMMLPMACGMIRYRNC